jgi:hypothetical protein
MNTKLIIGAALIAVGILGAVLSATADITGLNLTQGDKDYVEFGWLQITAFAAGILILIAGIAFAVLSMLKKKAPEPATPPALPEGPETAPVQEQTAAQQQSAQTTQPSAEASSQAQALQYQQAQAPEYQQTQDTQYDQFASTQEAQAQAEGQTSESLNDLEGLDGLDSLSDDLGIDMGSQGEYECPDCGAKLAANATACPSCGANFSEEVFECPVCGVEVPKDAKECPKCGEQLADSFVDAKAEG